MTQLTTQQVRQLFEYKDGALYWKKSPSRNTPAGSRAGCRTGTKYENISIKGRLYAAHRLIWLWHDKEPCGLIDHINRNPFDNRIENLRAASPSQNQHNRVAQTNSKLGVKGVFIEGGRYCAQIQVNGKRRRLGAFSSLEEAAKARQKAESTLLTTEFAPC